VQILINERSAPCEVFSGYKYYPTERRWKKQDEPQETAAVIKEDGMEEDEQGNHQDDAAHRIEQEWLVQWYTRGYNMTMRKDMDTLDIHYFNISKDSESLKTTRLPNAKDKEDSLIELIKIHRRGVQVEVGAELRQQEQRPAAEPEVEHQEWAEENLTQDYESEDSDPEWNAEVELQDSEQDEERVEAAARPSVQLNEDRTSSDRMI
jgi:hypothetical protein